MLQRHHEKITSFLTGKEILFLSFCDTKLYLKTRPVKHLLSFYWPTCRKIIEGEGKTSQLKEEDYRKKRRRLVASMIRRIKCRQQRFKKRKLHELYY